MGPKRDISDVVSAGHRVVLAIQRRPATEFATICSRSDAIPSFYVPAYLGNDVFAYRDVIQARIAKFFRAEDLQPSDVMVGYESTPEALVLYLEVYSAMFQVWPWRQIATHASDDRGAIATGLDDDNFPRHVMPVPRFPARRFFCSASCPLYIHPAFRAYMAETDSNSTSETVANIIVGTTDNNNGIWTANRFLDETGNEQHTYLYHGLDGDLPYGYRLDAFSWYTPSFSVAKRFTEWKSLGHNARVYRYILARTPRLLVVQAYPSVTKFAQAFERHFGSLESSWSVAGSYQFTELLLRYTSYDGWAYDGAHEPQVAFMYPVTDVLLVDSYLKSTGDVWTATPVRSNRRSAPEDDAFFVTRAVTQESVAMLDSILQRVPAAARDGAWRRAFTWAMQKQPRFVTGSGRWWTLIVWLLRHGNLATLVADTETIAVSIPPAQYISYGLYEETSSLQMAVFETIREGNVQRIGSLLLLAILSIAKGMTDNLLVEFLNVLEGEVPGLVSRNYLFRQYYIGYTAMKIILFYELLPFDIIDIEKDFSTIETAFTVAIGENKPAVFDRLVSRGIDVWEFADELLPQIFRDDAADFLERMFTQASRVKFTLETMAELLLMYNVPRECTAYILSLATTQHDAYAVLPLAFKQNNVTEMRRLFDMLPEKLSPETSITALNETLRSSDEDSVEMFRLLLDKVTVPSDEIIDMFTSQSLQETGLLKNKFRVFLEHSTFTKEKIASTIFETLVLDGKEELAVILLRDGRIMPEDIESLLKVTLNHQADEFLDELVSNVFPDIRKEKIQVTNEDAYKIAMKYKLEPLFRAKMYSHLMSDNEFTHFLHDVPFPNLLEEVVDKWMSYAQARNLNCTVLVMDGLVLRKTSSFDMGAIYKSIFNVILRSVTTTTKQSDAVPLIMYTFDAKLLSVDAESTIDPNEFFATIVSNSSVKTLMKKEDVQGFLAYADEDKSLPTIFLFDDFLSFPYETRTFTFASLMDQMVYYGLKSSLQLEFTPDVRARTPTWMLEQIFS